MKTYNTQSLVAQQDKWLWCPLIYVQTFSITVVCSTVKLLQFSPNTTPLTSLQLPWLDAGRDRKRSSGKQPWLILQFTKSRLSANGRGNKSYYNKTRFYHSLSKPQKIG